MRPLPWHAFNQGVHKIDNSKCLTDDKLCITDLLKKGSIKHESMQTDHSYLFILWISSGTDVFTVHILPVTRSVITSEAV